MYLKNHESHDCCGCGACMNICPKQCITMREDIDGFVFPQIDESACIHCHRCENVCPEAAQPKIEERTDPVMAAVKVRDEELLLKSASGGAFTAVVNWFLEQGDGYIYGAAWDKDLKVRHICSHNAERMDELRGSKYVQSDLGNCFNEIKQQLKEGKRVLFSGAPCQVAALRNTVCSSKLLVCVDLVCHGAPSQKIFDDYISEEEKRFQKKITGVRFRYKIQKGKKWTTRNILLTCKDGKKIPLTRFKTDFLRAYHPCLMNRESCYECVYSKPERYGDITIGDFWGINRYYKDLSVEHGVSIVQSNTVTGSKILDHIKKNLDFYPVDRKQYLKKSGNSLAKSGGIKKNPQRARFLELERTKGFHKAVAALYPLKKDFFRLKYGEFKKLIKRLLKK